MSRRPRIALLVSCLALPGLTLIGCDQTEQAITGSMETGRRTASTQNLHGIATALMAWHTTHNRWPTNEEGLSVLVDDGTVRQSDLNDIHGNPVQYRAPTGRDQRPKLFSKGRDGEAGTADDVVYQWPF